MREGLRSGKLLLSLEKDEKEKFSPHENVQQMKEKGYHSDPHLVLSNVGSDGEALITRIQKKHGTFAKDCTEDWEERLVENERKRRTGGAESSECGGVVKKVVNEREHLDYEGQIDGSALRSGLGVKGWGEEEGERGDSESGFAGKVTWSRGREKKKAKAEKDTDQPVGGLSKKMKRKHGRPSKEEKEGIDSGIGGQKVNLKRKRGRPPKVQKDGVDQSVGRLKKLKCKRGRRPKLEENKVVSRADLIKGGRVVGSGRGGKDLKLSDSLQKNAPSTSSCLEKRSSGKELNLKKNNFSKDLETGDNTASLQRAHDMADASSVKKQTSKAEKSKQGDEDVEPGKYASKQVVREKITDLLFRAGWTVEYRPRSGRSYRDAVYVSPDGKTHWSVTLAYSVLKEHYEAGYGESKTYKAGFVFDPITEEEFGMLKRVVSKTRLDKNKKRKKCEDGQRNEVWEKKRHNEKPSSIVSHRDRSVKGRMKGRSSFHEHVNSAGTSEELMPISVRGREQQTKNKNRCALLVRNTEEGVDSDVDGYTSYNGKRTVLAWMIDLGMVPLNGKVTYMNQRRTRVRLEGRITRDGIHCECCSEIIPISKFEAHAGSNLSKPYRNIFLETGTSLLQCLLDSWNKQGESQCKGFHSVDVDGEDPSDDACGICGDGGDLICCDGCPSTFHQSCLDIKRFPSGDWYCVYCSCKFCGIGIGNTYERHDNDDIAVCALLKCCLCEEKFHRSCMEGNDATSVDSSYPAFCGKECQELFERLQMLLGVKHELDGGFSWTVIRRSDVGSDISPSEIPLEVVWNSKLAVAFFVMDECFLPLVDHRSGVNLIRNILYNCGSNFTRLNYSGFLTIILERDDEIISAASIRIHGSQLAEMPFIGTRHIYRRQGMCRRLLSAIESVLCSLNVEKLVIPAISELRETWTTVFGFKPLETSIKQKMRNTNMLVFPGTDMLQKPLLKKQFTEDSMISTQGVMSTELQGAHNAEARYSPGSDMNASTMPYAAYVHGRNAPTALESCLQIFNGSLNDRSDIPGEAVDLPKCVTGVRCQVQMHMNHDNLEENKSTVKPLVSVYDAPVPTEEIRECQFAASGLASLTPDEKTIEWGSRSDHESKFGKIVMVSHIEPEASDRVKPFFSHSKEDTGGVDFAIKIEDSLSQHNHSSQVCRPAEIITTWPQEVACEDVLEYSSENVVIHRLGAGSQMSHDAEDIKHYGSQQLQVVRCALESDERMLDPQELKISHAAVPHMSTSPDEVDPTSTGCSGSQIPPKTSNISCDVAVSTLASACMFHPTSSVPERGQTITNVFPVDSNISPSSQANGLDTHESDVSAVVAGRSPFSCEVSLNPILKTNLTCLSKGPRMSTEIAFGSYEVVVGSVHEKSASTVVQTTLDSTSENLVPDRHEVKKLSKQFESGSQVDYIGPRQYNSKSLEECESASQIDQGSIKQRISESICDFSSASDVALHCATSGGNSCGTPEVIVLSNQAS